MANQYDEAVIVALGGNQPFQGMEPIEVLEVALDRFPSSGMHVVKRSSWWRSKAWPDPDDPPFVNGVVLVETDLAADAVMAALLNLERAFGRERDRPNAPRTLDLDLIAYGRQVSSGDGLVLPHPRAAERRFVMGPLAEVAPAWRHPLSGATSESLAGTAKVGIDAAPIAALHKTASNIM